MRHGGSSPPLGTESQKIPANWWVFFVDIVMKYFLDTEFIEGSSMIELISIGIVAEDGRTYYAINGECNFDHASDWVKNNVLIKLPPNDSFDWKMRATIKEEILSFIIPDETIIPTIPQRRVLRVFL